MKIVLDMVISPNGYIAREDGSEDWLPDEGWHEFVQLATNLNNIVMGRETYTQVMKRNQDDNFDAVPCAYKVIVTRDKEFHAPGSYTVVYSPEEAIDYLQSVGIQTLFLIGGGTLNAAFMQEGLIDELHLTITPYLIGEGRPVFAPNDFEMPLELVEQTGLSAGRIKLKYRIIK